MKKVLFVSILLSFILIGCSVTQTLDLTSSRQGSAEAEIKVDPFFITLLDDFSTIAPSTTQYTLMEEAMISFSNSIALSSFSDKVTLLGDDTGRNYYLSFSFLDILGLIEDLEKSSSNSILEAGEKSLSFHLDMDNYIELREAIPFLADPNFEVYGPEYNNGMSEDDYKEMIWFLLGDEGPDALEKGSVTLTINLPGEIVEAEGCTIQDKDTVEFTFPIIDFLLLNRPLGFSVSWKE